MTELIKDKNFHKSLDILTEKLKLYPLSNFDLKEIVPNIKITVSKDLEHIKFADELINNQNIGILLWLYGQNEGHWLALIKDDDTKQFEIFDSYAFPFKDINKELKIKDKNFVVKPSILLNIIKNSGYTPVFNNNRLQSITDDNACGRYAMLRLVFYNYDIHTFHIILKEIEKKYNINPLELSILTTYKDIKK